MPGKSRGRKQRANWTVTVIQDGTPVGAAEDAALRAHRLVAEWIRRGDWAEGARPGRGAGREC